MEEFVVNAIQLVTVYYIYEKRTRERVKYEYNKY